jgi:hypothetical protein
MFESDEKKLLKNKYNKLSSISGATGKKMKGGMQSAAHFGGFNSMAGF